MSQLLDGLNESQKLAVAAPDGPVLVLAGPGSGKTRVLTHRVAWLVQEAGVAPWRIMAVTFTNKAAREMRERTEKILGSNLRGLSVGTFHSTCARILRREVGESLPHYTRDFVIFDTDDQKAAIKQAMADLNIDEKKFNPNNMRNGVSQAKNALIRPEDYQANNYMGEMIGRIYRRYQDVLITNNAMDFDDLLMNTVILFDQAPTVVKRYQEQYQHVLIDEFQDTNLTQYGIISRLVGENNLFAVGDADQSIYRWRGADVRNMQRFYQDYPDALEIKLEQNYRSTQVILDVAQGVIQNNPDRVDKALFTERKGGEQVHLKENYNDLEEASQVTHTIKNLMLEGYNPGDCAVMYRTNAQSRSLEEAFIREGMPYRLVGATRFYNRREIKDIVAYLRLIHNPADEFSFARIVNTPKRGVGGKTISSLKAWGQDWGWQPGEAVMEMAKQPDMQHPFTMRAYKPLSDFGRHLNKWNEQKDAVPIAELLDQVLEAVGYKAYLDDGTDEGEERWANVIEFRNVATLAGDIKLNEFLEEVALVSEVDNLDEETKAATLLTLHAAKGLEFPVVFLVGLEERILPHSRSIESDDREEMSEERRLFYVGVTRAKDRLYLSYAFQRMNWGRLEAQSPSRFLKEIPEHLIIGGRSGRSGRSEVKKKASSWSWDKGDSGGHGNRPKTKSFGDDPFGGSSSKPLPKRSSGRPGAAGGSSQKRPVYGQDTDRNAPKKKVRTSIPDASQIEARRAKNKEPFNTRPTESEMAQSTRPPASKNEVEFKTGDRVMHAKFGQGIVMSSKLTGADEEVTIIFTEGGAKKLVASMAKLEKI
ncbi:MAG: DNA helicase-2/ATP-dependent DNA helicase PcrA [Candidatus Promineifilaceae bacterium]|jgi:DNA helicase-2/ATP-dependent DNA helicase PcrA